MISSAEEHDRVIAFTSQMAHVVSNALLKARRQEPWVLRFLREAIGILPELPYLDAEMWTELFMENKG